MVLGRRCGLLRFGWRSKDFSCSRRRLLNGNFFLFLRPLGQARILVGKNARLFALDTVAIAREVSSLADLQQRMQGIVLLGVFLRVTPFQEEHSISDEVLFKGIEKSLRKYFGKRGEQVVQDNLKAVSRGFREVIEIPREAMTLPAGAKTN